MQKQIIFFSHIKILFSWCSNRYLQYCSFNE